MFTDKFKFFPSERTFGAEDCQSVIAARATINARSARNVFCVGRPLGADRQATPRRFVIAHDLRGQAGLFVEEQCSFDAPMPGFQFHRLFLGAAFLVVDAFAVYLRGTPACNPGRRMIR